MIAPIMIPARLLGGGTGGSAPGAGAGVVMTGRDMVVLAEAGLLAGGTAGRDIVDEVDDAAAAAPIAAAARIPVLDAGDRVAPAPARIPVDDSDPVDTDFVAEAGEGAAAGVLGGGAVVATVLAPAPGKVVPHCTQNFAPG
jgi:CubicO group peptidase (beta-lactamase class C family)